MAMKKLRRMLASIRRPGKYDIGDPEDVVHVEHIDFSNIKVNPNSPTGFDGLPDKYADILGGGGIKKQDVIDHADEVIGVLITHTQGVTPLPTQANYDREMMDHLQIRHENPQIFYDKRKRLGAGAGGEVWEAVNRKTGDVFAVKIANAPPEDGNEEEHKNNIKREIALHAMSKHDNIVRYYDSFSYESKLWVILELMNGGDITSLCGKDKKWEDAGIAYVCQQVAQALEMLHANHKLHRDIKSDNILYNFEGEVKIADFGFAAGLNKARQNRTSIVGTPYWMSPELIKADPYDQRVDVWSLGITAIEMADGQPPLIKNTQPLRALLLITVNPPPTASNPEDWSPNFNHFLEVALKKDPKERPTSRMILMHPFIKDAYERHQFKDWVNGIRAEKKAREEKMKRELEQAPPTDADDLDFLEGLYSKAKN